MLNFVAKRLQEAFSGIVGCCRLLKLTFETLPPYPTLSSNSLLFTVHHPSSLLSALRQPSWERALLPKDSGFR